MRVLNVVTGEDVVRVSLKFMPSLVGAVSGV